jgi:hypothetical protein
MRAAGRAGRRGPVRPTKCKLRFATCTVSNQVCDSCEAKKGGLRFAHRFPADGPHHPRSCRDHMTSKREQCGMEGMDSSGTSSKPYERTMCRRARKVSRSAATSELRIGSLMELRVFEERSPSRKAQRSSRAFGRTGGKQRSELDADSVAIAAACNGHRRCLAKHEARERRILRMISEERERNVDGGRRRARRGRTQREVMCSEPF